MFASRLMPNRRNDCPIERAKNAQACHRSGDTQADARALAHVETQQSKSASGLHVSILDPLLPDPLVPKRDGCADGVAIRQVRAIRLARVPALVLEHMPRTFDSKVAAIRSD